MEPRLRIHVCRMVLMWTFMWDDKCASIKFFGTGNVTFQMWLRIEM